MGVLAPRDQQDQQRVGAFPQTPGLWRPVAGFGAVLAGLYGIWDAALVVPLVVGAVVAVAFALLAAPLRMRSSRYPGTAAVFAVAIVVVALVGQFDRVTEGPSHVVACVLALVLAGVAFLVPYRWSQA